MKVVGTWDIHDEDYFHYCHKCTPIIWKNNLYYGFKTRDLSNSKKKGPYEAKIVVLQIDLKGQYILEKNITLSDSHYKTIHGVIDPASQNENMESILLKAFSSEGRTINSTSNWKFQTDGNKLQLFIGAFTLNVSNPEIEIYNYDPAYKTLTVFESSPVKSEYHLGDKLLKYNERSRLECFDKTTNDLLWRKILKGYIYTRIEERENLIFFGTAGKGGAFYCLNINNGQIVTEYNNGNASEFAWLNKNVIIKDKKGNLVKLNPFTGEVLETLGLKEKFYFYSPIYVNGNKIITSVYNYKKKVAKLIYLEDRE